MSCVAFFITPYSLIISSGFLRYARNDKRDAEHYRNIERTHLSTRPNKLAIGFSLAHKEAREVLGKHASFRLQVYQESHCSR